MSMGTSTFDVDARTDRGRQRASNQDNVGRADQWHRKDGISVERDLRERYGRLYVVADGVGGNADGADASRIVVDEVINAFYYGTRDDQFPEAPVDRLKAAIEYASRQVFAEAKRRRNNMASTVVAALIHGNTLTVANVGDSPAILCRVNEQPKTLIKEHIRRSEDGGKALSQAMGDKQVYPSLYSTEWRENDVIVLCSDGLTDLVTPEEIADIVLSTPNARQATRKLINLANQRGGHDNISAVVVRHAPPTGEKVIDRSWSVPIPTRRQFLAVIGLVALSVLSFIGFLSVAGSDSGSGSPTTVTHATQFVPTVFTNNGSNSNPVLGVAPTSTLGALPPEITPTMVTPTVIRTGGQGGSNPGSVRPTSKPSPTRPLVSPAVTQLVLATDTPTTKVVVPNVIGKPLAEAEKELKNLGLQPIVEEIEKPDGNPGHVFEMSPPPGAEVEQGTIITLKVAKSLSPSPTAPLPPPAPTNPPPPPPAPTNPPPPPPAPTNPPPPPPAPTNTPAPPTNTPAPPTNTPAPTNPPAPTDTPAPTGPGT